MKKNEKNKKRVYIGGTSKSVTYIMTSVTSEPIEKNEKKGKKKKKEKKGEKTKKKTLWF